MPGHGAATLARSAPRAVADEIYAKIRDASAGIAETEQVDATVPYRNADH